MCADRVRLKDRILEGVSKAVKEVQAFSYEQGSEPISVKNDDRPLQKLVECLDHAFLHGLRHITPGYWAIVKKFTHRDIVLEIAKLDRLATDLGRSRAWLYQSLNDTALESYIRCFLENKGTARKFYVEHALMRDKERLVLLQTLVSGLDFVTFDLQLNIAYFDLVSHIPRSASVDGDNEDQISVHSFDDTSSVTSALSGAVGDIDEISLASTPGESTDTSIKSFVHTPPDVTANEACIRVERCPQMSPITDDIKALDDGCSPKPEESSPRNQPSVNLPNDNGESTPQKLASSTIPDLTEESLLNDQPVTHSQSDGADRKSSSAIDAELKASTADDTKPEESLISNQPEGVKSEKDVVNKSVRPVSLATASRIERLSSISQGEDKKATQEDDVLVIRLKGKKGKKSKKKKKVKSLSQGNTPTCAAPGFVKEEDTASLEYNLENRSKSSSFSSQSTSDKGSVQDLAMPSSTNQDDSNRSSQVVDAEYYQNFTACEQILSSTRLDSSSDAIDGAVQSLQDQNKHINDQKESDQAKKIEEKDVNEIVIPETSQENVQYEPITTLLSTKANNESQCSRIENLPKTSSLDYDTTTEYSLSSLHFVDKEVKPSVGDLSQVQFESSMDDSMMSIDDPGYTNLLIENSVASSLLSSTANPSSSDLSASGDASNSTGQGSTANPSSSDLSASGDASSSTGQGSYEKDSSVEEERFLVGGDQKTEGDDLNDLSPLGERFSPEGIDSSKVILDGLEVKAVSEQDYEVDKKSMEETKDTECTDDMKSGIANSNLDNEILTHPAEVVVDNNAKLYLMLEIFNNEHEEFKKLVHMSTGHTEGDLEPCFVLLTDQAIYLLRRGEKINRYIVDTRIVYNQLDYISVAINYQTIQLVCANRRNQYWLNTGDEQLSRYFLQELSKAMESGCRTRNLPSILTDATTQLISMQKFAANECHTEMQDTKVHLYSLIHWEDLVDSSTEADMQLYQPMIIKEGKLQYKCAGSFLVGSYWKDAYFMLRNDTIYRFGHRKDKDPELAVQLRTQHFGGCRRVRSGERPHCFELILQDGTTLEIACKNEMDVSNWLQAICSVVAQGVMMQHKGTPHTPCQPCCSVLAESKLLICQEDCQTNFYRSLASCDIADINSVAVDKQVEEYFILEFQPPGNPWVIYFNCRQEKEKFLRAMGNIWKHHFQVDIPVHNIEDKKVQKRCQECLTLIKSAWQRCDSITRGRIGGNIW